MSFLAAALLGIVQGLTEFLPVSSSGHLIIARELFGLHMTDRLDLAFDVACHVGTLLAVVVFFWRELLGMVRALPGALSANPGVDARRIQLIVAGTLPVVVVGLLGGITLEETLRSPAVVVVTLILGAFWLFAAERFTTHQRVETELTHRHAFLIGVAQSVALVPGVSRSGATIGAGMFLGYRRQDVARFTFLLSVPAILAAAGKNALELRHSSLAPGEIQAFAIAMATSAVVGYLAIRFFIRYVANHRLDLFAWYRLILAAVLLISLLR